MVFLTTSVVNANTLEQRLRTAFNAGELEGLHAVLVIHNGEKIAEEYFPGEDETWGAPLGVRQFDEKSLHDLRSVTKSVTGLLYGIALSEGIVPEPESILIDQFPEYTDLADDPQRRQITVGHALSMMMGTQWNEEIPYTNPANSEVAMEMAPDRYRYVLDRPMVHEPGKVWIYNGGATTLISKLIAIGAGRSLDEYAREKLFKPLGIDEFVWMRGSDNSPSAASGLRMTARDLAKIGKAVLNNGIYDDLQLIPQSWIEESFKPHVADADGWRYGYFWWLSPDGDPPTWATALGNGGQQLTIKQDANLVVVTLAGNYNKKGAWELPDKIINEFVFPAVSGQ